MNVTAVRMPEITQCVDAGAMYARHHHAKPYAALVLRGGYEEAGSYGRWYAVAGDVLVHEAFEAHRDRFGRRTSAILNFPLAMADDVGVHFGRCLDVDEIVRSAHCDPREAARQLIASLELASPRCMDWPDMLAAALARKPALSLSRWAAQQGLRTETVSRGFHRAYGVTPARFRREARARLALRMLRQSHAALCEVAIEAGFADQAHMTRDVVSLTGLSPGEWRSGQIRSRPVRQSSK